MMEVDELFRNKYPLMKVRELKHCQTRHCKDGRVLALYNVSLADKVTTYATVITERDGNTIDLLLFPGDRQLPWLPSLMDVSLMSQMLDLKGDLAITPLSYTPEMRATFLFSFSEGVLVGKTDVKKSSSHIFESSQLLKKSVKGKQSFVEIISFLSNPPLTLQHFVPGKPLVETIKDPLFSKVIDNVVIGLRSLHEADCRLPNIHSIDKEIRRLKRSAEILLSYDNTLKWVLTEVVDCLTSQLEALETPFGPIHSDFHHSNILVNGSDITIIDIDDVAHGPPGLDVGRFLSSLRFPFFRLDYHLDSFYKVRSSFLESYAPQDTAVFEASSLISSAASAYRFQRPLWESVIPVLLNEVKKMCSTKFFFKSL